MMRKFVLLWAASTLSTAAVGSEVKAATRTILVKGQVNFEDGTPVQGGTVTVTELYGLIGRMPEARPVAIRATNRDGHFSADIKNVRGVLDFRLVRDRCSWTGTSTQLSTADLRSGQEVTVVLRPNHDECPCP